MLGAEIVEPGTRKPAKEKIRELIHDISRAGVVMTKCGDSTLRFAPPLILNAEQAREAMEIVVDQVKNA